MSLDSRSTEEIVTSLLVTALLLMLRLEVKFDERDGLNWRVMILRTVGIVPFLCAQKPSQCQKPALNFGCQILRMSGDRRSDPYD